MLEFNASAFFEVTMAIQHTLTSIKIKTSSQESKDGGVMIVPIDDNIFIGIMIDRAIKLREHLNVLDARLTIMYVNRLQKYLDAGFVTYGELSRFYEEICSRLADELHLRKIFVVEGKAEKYFDPEEPLFGREFAYRFQRDGVYELDEAAKCLALGRPTAAVFHLLRLMEIGIGSVARCLQIPDPVKPVERNWGKILERVNSGIAQKWPLSSDRMSGDGALFEGLHASLDAVKNPWRNATMHIENKYTDDEAEHIFFAVQGFMKKAASRMDENGDPKV